MCVFIPNIWLLNFSSDRLVKYKGLKKSTKEMFGLYEPYNNTIQDTPLIKLYYARLRC